LDNYPTLSELSKEITEKLSGKDSTINHYTHEILTPLKDNFEHLLTYLSSDLPWKSEEQIYTDRALYSKISDTIVSIFNEKARFTIKRRQEIYEVYRNLFNFFSKNDQNVDFISLNYDLLLEIILDYSFKNKGGKFDENDQIVSTRMYQFAMSWILSRSAPRHGPDVRRTNPRIVKLHGSINWFWTGTSASETIYCKILHKGEEEENIDAGLTPYIIPPVMDKNVFYNHTIIKSLWKKAKELLYNADEIYIIGFSFPQTDISVRFLFQSSLEGKQPNIYVVNKVDEVLKASLYQNYAQIFVGHNINYDFCKDDDVIKELGKFLENHNI
jgi:hypothetical protein